MTRIERIETDLIRENPYDPCHPRAISRNKRGCLFIGNLANNDSWVLFKRIRKLCVI